jgi:hypothetical protein
MSFPAILIGVALLLASILIVAEPLIRKKRLKTLDKDKYPRGSRRSYDQTLLALRDLDFDYQLGIVAESDYQQLRALLMAEAAEAYEKTAPDDGNFEQLIETAVRDRRQHIGDGHSRCANCGTDLESADKFCAACGLHARGTCPQCDEPLEHADKFCSSCGAQLAIEAGVVA